MFDFHKSYENDFKIYIFLNCFFLNKRGKRIIKKNIKNY